MSAGPACCACWTRPSRRPLILVVAPAGVGKTVLLAGWAAETAAATGWLSLDESDQDPTAAVVGRDRRPRAARTRLRGHGDRPAAPPGRGRRRGRGPARRPRRPRRSAGRAHRRRPPLRGRREVAAVAGDLPPAPPALAARRRAVPPAAGAAAGAHAGARPAGGGPPRRAAVLCARGPRDAGAHGPLGARGAGSRPPRRRRTAGPPASSWRRWRPAPSGPRATPPCPAAGDEMLVDDYVWGEVLASEDPDLVDVLLDVSVVDRVSAQPGPGAHRAAGRRGPPPARPRPGACSSAVSARRAGSSCTRSSAAPCSPSSNGARPSASPSATPGPRSGSRTPARRRRRSTTGWPAGRPREALSLLAASHVELYDSGREATVEPHHRRHPPGGGRYRPRRDDRATPGATCS